MLIPCLANYFKFVTTVMQAHVLSLFARHDKYGELVGGCQIP